MQRTLIWDIPTRLFHWTLAISFGLAWLTAESDRWLPVHVFLGYLMLGLVGFRVAWGFVGSHFSRFASFWFGPRQALAYLKDIAGGHAARHVGHNPTGSVAIYLLLALTVAAGVSGILTLGGDERQGLAAGWLSFSQGKLLKSLHEMAATLMLVVVLGHITGVLVESVIHRENLVRAMLTGFKLAAADTPKTLSHGWVGAALLLAMLGFAGWWFDYALEQKLDTQAWHIASHSDAVQAPHVKFVGKVLPDNASWREECGSCHAAFYPALLPARSWQKMMDEQSRHFGTDLGLDPASSAAVLKFMVDNAADAHQTEAGFKIDQSVAKNEKPQRITATAYWIRKHRDIAAADWANPQVLSNNNCPACHSDADAGTFEDGAMQIPKK